MVTGLFKIYVLYSGPVSLRSPQKLSGMGLTRQWPLLLPPVRSHARGGTTPASSAGHATMPATPGDPGGPVIASMPLQHAYQVLMEVRR